MRGVGPRVGVATWVEHDGVQLLHLTALEALGGVRAVFTGRQGGVSARWGGGLNWSVSVGDQPESVRENRRRSIAALGLTPGTAVMAGLVHGNRVAALPDATGDAVHPDGPLPPSSADEVRLIPETDALITDRPGLGLVVTAADCVPVYLYDPVRRVVGVAHAGWRGTVAGIAAATVRAMAARFGCDPADVHAAIGPSIGPCCYEVDDAVVRPVRGYYGDRAQALLRPGARAGRHMLDLWTANRLDLESAGVRHIHLAEVCTACQRDRLFSHRAEGGTAGRGAAIIALI
nr:peptidoglycan editing factor PgeF [Symbiobacterium terraclitae]